MLSVTGPTDRMARFIPFPLQNAPGCARIERIPVFVELSDKECFHSTLDGKLVHDGVTCSIYLRRWREAMREKSVLPKNTTHWSWPGTRFSKARKLFGLTKLFCYNLHLKRERYIRWILLLPSFRKCSLIFWSVSLYTPRRGSFPFTTKITACAYLANVRARFAAASDFCLSPGFWS